MEALGDLILYLGTGMPLIAAAGTYLVLCVIDVAIKAIKAVGIWLARRGA